MCVSEQPHPSLFAEVYRIVARRSLLLVQETQLFVQPSRQLRAEEGLLFLFGALLEGGGEHEELVEGDCEVLPQVFGHEGLHMGGVCRGEGEGELAPGDPS